VAHGRLPCCCEKDLAEGRQIVLIAQEIGELPGVISTDDEGYKSVEYGNIVSMLVDAIKACMLLFQDLFHYIFKLFQVLDQN